jgi:predicted GIY-YIG superfamily endonuclease
MSETDNIIELNNLTNLNLNPKPNPNNYVVYVLTNTTHNKTYVGITNNTTRRIRQHNGELVGGAKYTTGNKGMGEWKFYGFIKNLGKHLALSLEKKIKIRSRKVSGTPIEKRTKAINNLLNEYNLINQTNLTFELVVDNNSC